MTVAHAPSGMILYTYLGMCVTVVGVMVWMDKRAVMRGQGTGVTAGTRKQPIPVWVDFVVRSLPRPCSSEPKDPRSRSLELLARKAARNELEDS